jgi:RNA polymerase sigma factor (sigma-70 family)
MDGLRERPMAVDRAREHTLIERWDPDIVKAARAAVRASGNTSNEHDFAQEARTRLLRASRDGAQLTDGYVRTTITNSVSNAARGERRALTVWSRHAAAVDTQIVAPPLGLVELIPLGVHDWAAYLPTRLQEVYQHLYVTGHNQREVARLMGLSQPRVAQLHARLLRYGRHDLAFLSP